MTFWLKCTLIAQLKKRAMVPVHSRCNDFLCYKAAMGSRVCELLRAGLGTFVSLCRRYPHF